MSSELFDLKENENPVKDLMGNDVIRGHLIAISKDNWRYTIQNDYNFGEPIDDTQMLSIPNKNVINKENRRLAKINKKK